MKARFPTALGLVLLLSACAPPPRWPAPTPKQASRVQISELTEEQDELAHERCAFKGVITALDGDDVVGAAVEKGANLAEPLSARSFNGVMNQVTCALFACPAPVLSQLGTESQSHRAER